MTGKVNSRCWLSERRRAENVAPDVIILCTRSSNAVMAVSSLLARCGGWRKLRG